jgi:hypothetical protein
MNDEFDNALSAWPMNEVPPDFSRNIMEKIKPRNSYAPLKFRLTWIDYALGLFLSLLPAVGFVSWACLPRQFLLRLQYQLLLLQAPIYEPILLITLGAVAILGIATFLIALRFLFPRQVSLF